MEKQRAMGRVCGGFGGLFQKKQQFDVSILGINVLHAHWDMHVKQDALLPLLMRSVDQTTVVEPSGTERHSVKPVTYKNMFVLLIKRKRAGCHLCYESYTSTGNTTWQDTYIDVTRKSIQMVKWNKSCIWKLNYQPIFFYSNRIELQPSNQKSHWMVDLKK